jgi:hypothetical protein
MADNPTRADPGKVQNKSGGKGGRSSAADQTRPTKAPDAGQPSSQRRD